VDIKKNIGLIFGPNGAGKGTLATHLADQYNLTHINSGHLVRNWIEKTHQNNLNQLVDNGILVEDEIMAQIFTEYFTEHADKDTHEIVLEGMPRTRHQVDILEQICDKFNYKIHWVILLELSLNEILSRVEDRVVAPDGNVYHMKFNPPPAIYSKDDLFQRPDDRPEIVKARYETYEQSTLECLTHPFLANIQSIKIDASEAIPQVYEIADKFLELSS
jgi:adenylate kinase